MRPTELGANEFAPAPSPSRMEPSSIHFRMPPGSPCFTTDFIEYDNWLSRKPFGIGTSSTNASDTRGDDDATGASALTKIVFRLPLDSDDESVLLKLVTELDEAASSMPAPPFKFPAARFCALAHRTRPTMPPPSAPARTEIPNRVAENSV